MTWVRNVYLFPWLHENFLLMTYAFEGEIQRFGCGPPCHVSIGENDCPQPDMLEKRSVVSSISDFFDSAVKAPLGRKENFCGRGKKKPDQVSSWRLGSASGCCTKKKREMGEKKLEKRTIGTARTTQNAVKTNAKRPKNNKNATAFYERWSNYILPF